MPEASRRRREKKNPSLHNFRSFTTTHTHKSCYRLLLRPRYASFSFDDGVFARDGRSRDDAPPPVLDRDFYLFFYACVLPKFPLRTKSRENLKGDFFAYICTQRERCEKKREKALERERRKKTKRSTKSFVSRTFASTEFGAIPGRARSRVGWFLAGGFARGFFYFLFFSLLCVLLAQG